MQLASEPNLDFSYTINRELSWLMFNERVLQLASDESIPLLERLKFVSIFTSNIDEFFMIRVGSLYDLSIVNEKHIDSKSGMNVQEQLLQVFEAVAPMYHKKDQAVFHLDHLLREYGVERLDFSELKESDRRYIDRYFKTDILPILVPQVIDAHHPFPHIENKSLHIAVMLKSKEDTKFGIIPVPKTLPRIVSLKNSQTQYILVEDVILKYVDKIFEMYRVQEQTIISVTRNADINPDDEALDFEEDFRHHMKKLLKRRARLSAVRLEIKDGHINALTDYLVTKLMITKDQFFHSASPLDMSYIYTLEDILPISLRRSITFQPYIPIYPSGLNHNESMIKQILNRDVLLHYPYESMEPYLNLMKEAATDPTVISIKITLYRLDKKSRLAEYLIIAAENNKDVTVIMELRARFDEKNNIEWAERLEEAGCKVIYGFMEYKIHSKVCLITLHHKNRLQHITQIGTGNYNEKTSKQYSDFSLMTADKSISADANTFFKNILISNLDGRYENLLVAPTSLKSQIFSLIDQEIAMAQKGIPCEIILKMNSLTDRDTIDKLSEASCVGVMIRLIIRGICCIVPGVKGKTENITVKSILGRYLEHSRVYCFINGNNLNIYLSSADLMTRNVERRIEVACPVLDQDLKNRILNILKIQLDENVKAWHMNANGAYMLPDMSEHHFDCQEYFMRTAMSERLIVTDARKAENGKKKPITSLIQRLLQHISGRCKP